MTFHAKITKRRMKRKNTSGNIVMLHRYILHFRDPETGQRSQRFFEKLRDAQAAQNELVVEVDKGIYTNKEAPTVDEAFTHLMNARRGQIKEHTLQKYEDLRPIICGPLLDGTSGQRRSYTCTGRLLPNSEFLPMLGKFKLNDLMTAQIRAWHRLVMEKVGNRTANKAKLLLSTVLSLAAEDFNVRPPMMPTRLGRGKGKEKKLILNAEQVGKVITHAKNDKVYGIYYAFGFLAGTRPSEQLGLLWEDVDLDKREIHIRRMQEINGEICNITKTAAGNRIIPISSTLYEMLLDWKQRCPHREGYPHRVFPNIGHCREKQGNRTEGGKVQLYSNFRTRIWKQGLKEASVPYVSPHSARHSFISILQSQGVEVGLVAKLAGHANIVVTLNHYTQAVRGGEDAVEKLAKAFA